LTAPAGEWNTRSLFRLTGTTVLLPNLLYGVGQGAIIPIIPLFASQIGASLAAAALAAAMLTMGQLVASLPAGWLVVRVGEKNGMYYAAAAAGAGAAICWVATNIGILIAGVFLFGMSNAVFALARHSFVTVAVPLSHRGRGLSLMAGANRLGVLLGPFISAVVVHIAGGVRPAFGTAVGSSVVIAVALWLFANDADMEKYAEFDRVTDGPDATGMWTTFKATRGPLMRVGMSAGLIATMRVTRQVLVPLIGVALGLSATTISLVVGVCAAVDFALFYMGGQLMDRFGRMWLAIPTMLAFAASHAVLAVVADIPNSFTWYVGASVFMSIGNGLTSGIVATMGSDLADQRAPAAFLGSWRLVTQLCPAAAPFVISALTGLFSIGIASFAMAGTALMGAGLLVRYVPRYLPKLPGGRH
jgi:MFS family permease